MKLYTTLIMVGFFPTGLMSKATAQDELYGYPVYYTSADGSTVIPALDNFCSGHIEEELIDFPYDTIVKGTKRIGKMSGVTVGCNSSGEKFEFTDAFFVDIPASKSSRFGDVCRGKVHVWQSPREMTVRWEVQNPSVSDEKCADAGKTFELKLRATKVLPLPYVTWSEYALVATSDPETLGWVTRRSLTLRNDGIPPEELQGRTYLRPADCDRGGADFPEAGVCYELNNHGEALGFVRTGSGRTGYLNLHRANVEFHVPQ